MACHPRGLRYIGNERLMGEPPEWTDKQDMCQRMLAA